MISELHFARQMRISREERRIASQLSGMAGRWAWLQYKLKWGGVEKCIILEAVVANDKRLKSTSSNNQGNVLAHVTKKFRGSVASDEVDPAAQ